MKIKWYFYNSGPHDVWICLNGPALRTSGCFKIKAGCQDCATDYEATPGFDEPNGTWHCEVYSGEAACDVTDNTIAQAAVDVAEQDWTLAHVTWFLTADGFGDPSAKVAYE